MSCIYMAPFSLFWGILPGVSLRTRMKNGGSMTPTCWLVIDPFLIRGRLGDSRYLGKFDPFSGEGKPKVPGFSDTPM